MTLPRRLKPSPDLQGETVALRGGRPLLRPLFERQTGGCAQALAGCERVVLTCRDSWNFAIGLLGALSAGAEVVLPANDLPATLAGLDGRIVDDTFQAVPAPWESAPDQDGQVLFQTSGSTGAPKLVARSLRQLLAEVAALHMRLGDQAGGGVTLSTVPHQHAFGLVFAVLWPLAAGRPFHAVRHELWEDVLAGLPPGGVLVTSPAHLSRMGGLPPLAPERRPNLVLSAGAPLPEDAAAEAWRVLGRAVTEIYGSTETGAVAVRLRDGGEPPWQALPGYELSADAEDVWHLKSAASAPGPLGDRLEAVAGGGFRLLGRTDRIAKIDGKRVALNAVEQVLGQLPEVSLAAALVLPAENVLGAVVELSAPGRDALRRLGAFRLGRQLRRAMADRLETAGLPRRWRFVDTLPQGPMGKRKEADLHGLFTDAPRLPEVMDEQPGDDDGIRLILHIPETLYWFQGHFPGRPILPGVVQLDWVLHFARARLGLDLPAAREFQVKYTAVVEPRQVLNLDLRHDAAKGRVVFAYRRDGGKVSSGTVYL